MAITDTIRAHWAAKAIEANNHQYANAIADPTAISVISRTTEVVLVTNLDYDWISYEQGEEEVDLKQKLLYGPKSRSILPKMTKVGTIKDPGGRWNVVPFEGGVTFRTVSTPRFDNRGRYIGSSPSSWIIASKPGRTVLSDALDESLPIIQDMIDLLSFAEL